VEFTATVYQALARKVAFKLQRIGATGVYGDDYRHKTLWDEYCHEIQEGPYELLETAWETVESIFNSIVEAVPPEEAVLLTIGAMWDLDEYEDVSSVQRPTIYPDLIRHRLRQAVSELAGARNMARFDPTGSG